MGVLKIIGIVIALVTAPLWTGLYTGTILIAIMYAVYEQVPGWMMVVSGIAGYLFCKWRHRSRRVNDW